MIFTGFDNSGWFIFFAYVLIVPLLNILLAPTLVFGMARGWLRPAIWRRYLIANGFFYIFAVWFPFYTTLELVKKLEHNIIIYKHLPTYVMSFGIMFQGIFFLIWLVSCLRKKELSDSYYRTWSAGFILLYLLPFVVHMSLGLFKF